MFEHLSEKIHSKKFKHKFYLFLVFLGILFLLIYSAFFRGVSFTGSVIGLNSSSDELGVKFDAEFIGIPEIELEGFFEEVNVRGVSDSFLYVGNEQFSLLDMSNNYMTFVNFEGKIYFNENNISQLSGKAESILFNGVSLSSKSGNTVKVSLEGLDYNFLEVKDDVFIRKLNYVTSGEISLNDGKSSFSLEEEEVFINSFKGDVRTDKSSFNLEGHVRKLELVGETDIIIG